MYIVKIRRGGDSNLITIPKVVCKETQLECGDCLVMHVEGKGTLRLNKVTDTNQQEVTDEQREG